MMVATLARFLHLAPLAGRGRIARERDPGEGGFPQVHLSPVSLRQPLTPTLSPRRAGRGSPGNAPRRRPLHLAPLAERGRMARERDPGEGGCPRVHLSPVSLRQPLTPTLSPRRAGRGGPGNAPRRRPLHLAPLAGGGRMARECHPGEGGCPRVHLSPVSLRQPLTPTLSPRRAGRGGSSRVWRECGTHV